MISPLNMFEPHVNPIMTGLDQNDLIHETIPEDDTTMINNGRPTIHWGPVLDGGESTSKGQINTDTDHFDALFARSNHSSPPPHPRCYSSCSPATAPQNLSNNPSTQPYAKSQPLLSSSPNSSSPLKIKGPQQNDGSIENPGQQSNASSSSSSLKTSSSSARMKRKNFSLTHAAQTFLQASNCQTEQLEPLARSCSYKRPQSIKKYRQKKKDKDKDKDKNKDKESQTLSGRPSQPISAPLPPSTSARKSIGGGRISAIDLMTTDDPQDQWSNLQSQRSGRVGSLPLDQLQLPIDGEEEIYRVRQFNTTSKGFVNRGDSFKRSFKRSGSISRRSSFRTNNNLLSNETSPTQDSDGTLPKEGRTSIHSLNNSITPNLNGIVDNHFNNDSNSLITNTTTNTTTATVPITLDDEEEEEDSPVVERIQTADGFVQDIRVYQVYLLGMSGTGKCSLIRQFKSTEYRGIYDYSSSIDDDPDNTVSIMLDGIESRLHIITIDIDLMKTTVTGDAYVVVYSITDRLSFQTAIQLIKNIREQEANDQTVIIKRHVPIILVGNKSDLVRKRSVTKEMARHVAFKYDCKFVETSAAINDKVDDLLAGTLKQIRLYEQFRTEQRRRLTLANGSIDTNDSEAPILGSGSNSRKGSMLTNRNSKNVFAKFFNVFRKKPTRLPADVENLNTAIR